MMKVKPVKLGKTERMSFSHIDEVISMPNLIEVQKNSYQWFLDEGLKEVFHDIGTIEDYTGNLALSFVDFRLDKEPKYSIKECKERDVTYAAPLRVTARLLNKETGEVKDQEIFMGDFPLMTDAGTFVINGAERAIVSQLVRSPGVFYGDAKDKVGNDLYSATMNPNRGAWLEYETDASDVFYVRIDKNRKLPVTVLCRALGLSTNEDILNFFGDDERILATLEKDTTKNQEEGLLEVYRKLRPGEPPTVESATSQINMLFFDPRRYDLSRFGRYKMNKKLSLARRITGQVAAENVVAPLTGEILIEAGAKITRELAEKADNAGVNLVVLKLDDPMKEESRKIKVITNGCVDAQGFFSFDVKECGINERCSFDEIKKILDTTSDVEEQKEMLRRNHDQLIGRTVTVADILASINYLNGLGHNIGTTDDIDHLGNRRLRSVGELLQNQIRIGLSRLERVVRERMAIQDADEVRPGELINIRPVSAAIKEFFGSSQLSQFMDQPNPLAELTHKRRLSALGPGGLNRDRASFEVRDVHYSHYARICPIETPEGPNIGLIGSLATYARINEYGFIEAPYRRVDKEHRRVTNEHVYMTADEEDLYRIATATEPLDENNCFVNDMITVREVTEYVQVPGDQVDFIDVSPRQVVSIATGMIPFLENDDATRALMGSNMQRQAVPLLVPEAPYVGTGLEFKAGHDSGVEILAREDGVVEKVDGNTIVIRDDLGERHVYHLTKFARTNQSNCANQRPVVSAGQRICKDDLLADGPSTEKGEIALGRNALIGFMNWEGYNYEDAVLLSEKLVKEDIYTSIHMEEFECEARESKLGPDEITRDIPNVGEDAVKDLDERGIIRIGAEVRAGDILVGKVTPKGETELTSEERLMRAIFGEKAREVRDTSLRVPHGEWGVVVDVKIFDRAHSDELSPSVQQMVRVYIAQKRKISVGDKMSGRHGNKGVVSRVLREEDMPFLPDGTPLQIVLNPLGVPSRMNIGQVLEVHLGLACRALGWHIATPVFDGATYPEIRECLEMAADTMAKPVDESNPRMMQSYFHNGRPLRLNLDEEGRRLFLDGKIRLRDGRTGNWFENPVTVGVMYFLKLHHLVDDKMHARSVGPYSLVTQQPLGGKAQFGGQRFGEMEVWALEAYGAAYTLQEILTIKSDDVVGRVKTYEAIVKGDPIPRPGIPESFRVMLKELQSLGLDIVVQDKEGNAVDMRQEFDDDDSSFENSDYDLGDNVMVESELQDEYSVKDADEGFDDDLDEDAGPSAEDLAAIESDSFDD